MSPFGRRELPPDTLGEALRIVREEVGLSVAELGARANVQPKYVAAIEAGRYEQTPGPAYVRGFLRSIAGVLNLSPDAVLGRYDEEPVQRAAEKSVDASAARTTRVVQPRLTYRSIRLLTIALIVGIVLAIFGVQVAHIVSPPALAITQPAADVVVTTPQVVLEGTTEPEVSVKVNGRSVQVDAQGAFHEAIDLQPGLNTLVVTAAKKSSRKATVIRRVLVQLPAVVQ